MDVERNKVVEWVWKGTRWVSGCGRVQGGWVGVGWR